MSCFAYAYADGRGVSVNLFPTREARDAAVRELLGKGFWDDDDRAPPFAPNATAEEAWDAFCNTDNPDFHLGFNELEDS